MSAADTHAALRALLAAGVPGDEISARCSAIARARVRDVVGHLPPRCAVLAQGGLARRQLLPWSDVDLVFLVDDDVDLSAAFDIGAAISRLWDTGLKASWAVRRPRELRGLFDSVDGKEGHAAAALLEARVIAGDAAFATPLLRETRRSLGGERRRRLLHARIDESLARRARFLASPSLVEPDLKDGPGALRDLQLLGQAGLCVSGADVADLDDDGAQDAPSDLLQLLLRAGVLFPSEVDALVLGRRELLTARAALVLSADRAETRLHAAAADAAAALLPPVCEGLRPGEALVRRVVRASRAILVTVDDVLARLVPTAVPARRPTKPDTAAGLGQLLSSRDIKTFPGPLTALLERGILQRVLADIARLEGRVKHDGIHAFTTDAHLARCGDLALAIVGGAESALLRECALPPPLQPVLARLVRPAIVVAGSLFHDIGKGLPNDHSVEGVAIARRELSGLGFSSEDIDDVCFLVEHHLLLSNAAQRRDLTDPAVVDELSAVVRTPERLDSLALVTWCDWCAVGPGVGTAWKARLLAGCVEVVREALLAPASLAREEADVRARACIDDRPGTRAFVEGASTRYLRGRSLVDIADDVAAYVRLKAAGGGAVVDVRPPQRAWILGRDRPGLLADLAAAFSSEGGNVLDARLDVRSDGSAFDCFVFDDGRGGALPEDTAARLEVALADALAGRVRRVSRTRPRTAVPPRVRFIDGGSDCVVEVRAADRRGLLNDLASAIAARGLTIHVARIHTEGARVTDLFSVRRADGGLPGAEERERLREALLSAIG